MPAGIWAEGPVRLPALTLGWRDYGTGGRDLHTQTLPCLAVPWAGLRALLLSHLPKPRLLWADTRHILVLPQHGSELLSEAEESLEASQGGGGSSESSQEILEYP